MESEKSKVDYGRYTRENKSTFVDTDNLFPGSFFERLLNRRDIKMAEYFRGALKIEKPQTKDYIKKLNFRVYRKIAFIFILWAAFIVQMRTGYINTFSFVLFIILDLMLILDIADIKKKNEVNIYIRKSETNSRASLIDMDGNIVGEIEKLDRLVIVENGYGVRVDDKEKKEKFVVMFTNKHKAEEARQRLKESMESLVEV